jgi:electron transport complex protein RnfA
MGLGGLLGLALGAILVNNFMLARFLGVCPAMGVTRRPGAAVGLGLTVVLMMTLASAVSSMVYDHVLVPLGIQSLKTVALVLVIASLVGAARQVASTRRPRLHAAFGAHLPLLTANCAVLGVVLINIEGGYGLVASTVHGLAAGVGVMLVTLLLAGLKERLDLAPVPEALRGVPIALVTTGLMTIAFMGFYGLTSM